MTSTQRIEFLRVTLDLLAMTLSLLSLSGNFAEIRQKKKKKKMPVSLEAAGQSNCRILFRIFECESRFAVSK